MSLRSTVAKLGPGLLFAGTAIGVSHVYQSTRAGAEYGYFLIWAVLLANVLKYPFFEFGPRYAMATGESLLVGYKRLGYWVLLLFLLVSLLTVFTIQAAVTGVTGALVQHVAGSALPPWLLAAIILGICALILAVGRYRLLDSAIKVIILLMSVATLAALAAAFGVKPVTDPSFQKTFDWSDGAAMALLIGLMGWMPAPIDLSVWHSLWALEKRKISGAFKIRAALFDFRLGYWGTALLALCFLGLGALVMYATMPSFPDSAGAFSAMLIDLYGQALGDWAKWIVAIAALTTMFSTTLTVLDAIPRVLSSTVVLLMEGPMPVRIVQPDGTIDGPAEGKRGLSRGNRYYWPFLIVLFLGALVVIRYFAGNLRQLVDLATILSFLTAPFFAIANFKLVSGPYMPEAHRPGVVLRGLSYTGMVFLVGFGIYYLGTRYLF